MPDGTRVRVINLSYGTDSTQAYASDPLAAAAENAWKHGIVVVTSAGNEGASAGHLTDPAIDPFVLAVGAADSGNQVGGWAHDKTTVAGFSNSAPTGRSVDLIAPGTSLVSTRAPGSYVDTNFPSGRVSGDTTARLFRGSGTSQAAAVVSGAVALLLQAYPTLTPDQVKYVLTASAAVVNRATPATSGAGIIDLAAAFDLAARVLGTDKAAAALRANAVQKFGPATGLGSIDAARGASALVDPAGNPLVGEIDVQGNPWDAATWARASSALTAWSGGRWLGQVWTGDGWSSVGSGLSSARWSSARWSSARWSSIDWSSARWSDASWTSARWSAASWTSARWSGSAW